MCRIMRSTLTHNKLVRVVEFEVNTFCIWVELELGSGECYRAARVLTIGIGISSGKIPSLELLFVLRLAYRQEIGGP